ncbi:STN domain-containing protein [Variovorax sp. 54]|uniref:STN domain-containing protein n=1 Tax=Variovorax sp. 54 TaxID=2035212 RepID=UPI000C19D955|nr:STN domain-containing protein [Variovorax sp. 54]
MIRIRRQPPTLLALFITRPRLALAVAGLLATGLAFAHAREFDVKGGELRPALDAYIAQSGVQLIYKMEDVKDLSTRGIKGKIAADAALDRLLDGTRLRVRRGQDGAMVLIAPARSPAAARSEPLPRTVE